MHEKDKLNYYQKQRYLFIKLIRSGLKEDEAHKTMRDLEHLRTSSQIARKLGVDRRVVFMLIKKHSIKPAFTIKHAKRNKNFYDLKQFKRLKHV